MEPTSHPDVDDADRDPKGMSVTAKVVLAVVGALLATVVLLHLTGVVGPAAH